MAKRKEPDTPINVKSTPTKRKRRLVETPTKSSHEINYEKTLSQAQRSKDVESEEECSPTPVTNKTTLFSTPSKTKRTSVSKSKADQSAKRKSANVLTNIIARGNDDDWDGSTELAAEILKDGTEDGPNDTIEIASTVGETPSKRGRGRPKGARNKRSPTPEGDLPPEERYFFQNRTGPLDISNNSFSATGLLSHDEYFEQTRKFVGDHQHETALLTKLHARAFLQWQFELKQGFGLCIYGWGSKRSVMDTFAKWMQPRLGNKTSIVMLNGYTSKINIRGVFNTIYNSFHEGGATKKLIGQPSDMVDAILMHLSRNDSRLLLMVNSIDGPSLRKQAIQSLMAALVASERVSFIASADSPNFQLLWNSTLRARFNFVFHDVTTFAPYEMETNPVDDVHELLGRKGRRVGGKEGIGFVLKSLPENARNLYRVLLTEILTILNDGFVFEEDEDKANSGRKLTQGGTSSADIGVEYRSLYQKASEEFICSSDMNFRFLLKEFHDHQILASRRDPDGVEMLSVPLAKDEMEAVLEDLVVD